MAVIRAPANPIITACSHPRIGTNINGPSLIRVPAWVTEPLGRYYLYFAHHQGDHIRLAHADQLEGPWTVHGAGVLDLSASLFTGHIASPDVHIDADERRIRLYYHGCDEGPDQHTRVALSTDGLQFTPQAEILGRSYFRVWHWRGWYYAVTVSGFLYRSASGLGGFEQRALPLPLPRMRHAAVRRRGSVLDLVYSNKGDCPERLLHTTIDLAGDWQTWTCPEGETLLAPELDWEGALEPLEPSRKGAIHHPANQLRDPALFVENGRTWLLYSVAGEQGLALAEWTAGR